jgi:hypothetical protein
MEGFKSLPKIQCFKEGGSVQREVKNFTKRDRKTVDEADTALDKKIVKKAIGMHDKQEHPGEKTDLSKLRKGGRAKKEYGTVKKYACGGGVYGAKKTKEDIKSIDDAKNCKPKKLAKGGKSVKKMADGGMSSPMADADALLDPMRAAGNAIGSAGTALKNNIMGTPEQNRIAQARMDMIAKKKAAEKAAMLGGLGNSMALQQGALAGQGAVSDNERAALTRMAPTTPAPGTMPMQKRGGKVKKCAEGGSLKEVDANENPGLSKLPTDVRNKMGYAKKGGKVC